MRHINQRRALFFVLPWGLCLGLAACNERGDSNRVREVPLSQQSPVAPPPVARSVFTPEEVGSMRRDVIALVGQARFGAFGQFQCSNHFDLGVPEVIVFPNRHERQSAFRGTHHSADDLSRAPRRRTV